MQGAACDARHGISFSSTGIMPRVVSRYRFLQKLSQTESVLTHERHLPSVTLARSQFCDMGDTK
jgi:hypothetical protein